MPPARTTGERVRTERLLAGHTLASLAEEADLHPTTIGLIERGVTLYPEPETLARLAAALLIAPSALRGAPPSARRHQEDHLPARHDPATLALRVRGLRERAEMSTRELASLADLNQGTVVNVENRKAKRAPKPSTIAKLAEALWTTPEALWGPPKTKKGDAPS